MWIMMPCPSSRKITMITLYSRPNCPQCDQAKQRLQSLDLQFVVVDVSQDTEARTFLLSQGHRSVPQIYVEDQLLVEGGWSGLNKLTADEILQRIRLTQPNTDQGAP